MKFDELVDICVDCIKAFNPVTSTIDSHAEDFLKNVRFLLCEVKRPLWKSVCEASFLRLHPLSRLLKGNSYSNLSASI